MEHSFTSETCAETWFLHGHLSTLLSILKSWKVALAKNAGFRRLLSTFVIGWGPISALGGTTPYIYYAKLPLKRRLFPSAPSEAPIFLSPELCAFVPISHNLLLTTKASKNL